MKIVGVRFLGVMLLTVFLAACGESKSEKTDAGAAAVADPQKVYHWKMVTAWPKNFPGLGTGANHLAKIIGEMSGGRLQIKVYGANELVGPLEIFDAVSRGTAQMGHGAAYYWKGKVPAAQFFASVPFGLSGHEMTGWLYHGGGMELWQEVYEPFGLLPLAVGNTGAQMGGWFNREINSLEDLKGLKMRIPGLGGEVLRRAGGLPVLLPGGEIYSSLETGAIDATEWIGPYNDLAFGLHKAAAYYYYPGWHEPGSVLELLVNKEAFAALPDDLQAIVEQAARAAYLDMLANFTAKNNLALDTLVNEHQVQVRRFPDDVLRQLRIFSAQVLAEQAENDPVTAKVYAAFTAYASRALEWDQISERAYLNARSME